MEDGVFQGELPGKVAFEQGCYSRGTLCSWWLTGSHGREMAIPRTRVLGVGVGCYR